MDKGERGSGSPRSRLCWNFGYARPPLFDWLFEGRTSVYVILAALAVFLLLLGGQTRKRWWVIAAVVVAATIGLYALLDRLVETDREQIVRKINAMAAAVNAHNLNAAFADFSDQFRTRGGKTKNELQAAAQSYLATKIVERVDVWDIVLSERPSREKGETQVRFSAKTHGVQEFLTDCEAIFEFRPEHGWQLKSFRLLKPQTNEEWPWQI
jgi:hypothetical protein